MINIKGKNLNFRSLDGRYIIDVVSPECLLMTTTLLRIEGINFYIKIEDLELSKTYIGILTVKENNDSLTIDISHWFLFGFKIEKVGKNIKMSFNKINVSIDLEVLENDCINIVDGNTYLNLLKETD